MTAAGLELLNHTLIGVSAFITGWLWRGWWNRRRGHNSHIAETPEEDPRG